MESISPFPPLLKTKVVSHQVSQLQELDFHLLCLLESYPLRFLLSQLQVVVEGIHLYLSMVYFQDQKVQIELKLFNLEVSAFQI